MLVRIVPRTLPDYVSFMASHLGQKLLFFPFLYLPSHQADQLPMPPLALPIELIQIILSHDPTVSDRDRLDDLSAFCQVSRQFHNNAVPLLYSSVKLVFTPQAATQFLTTLTSRPDLRLLVKSIMVMITVRWPEHSSMCLLWRTAS
jgi:hypothetical protein